MSEMINKGETAMTEKKRFQVGDKVYVNVNKLTEKIIGTLKGKIGIPATVVSVDPYGPDEYEIIWEGERWTSVFWHDQLMSQRERMHVAR
jgi:hypothetical protein